MNNNNTSDAILALIESLEGLTAVLKNFFDDNGARVGLRYPSFQKIELSNFLQKCIVQISSLSQQEKKIYGKQLNPLTDVIQDLNKSNSKNDLYDLNDDDFYEKVRRPFNVISRNAALLKQAYWVGAVNNSTNNKSIEATKIFTLVTLSETLESLREQSLKNKEHQKTFLLMKENAINLFKENNNTKAFPVLEINFKETESFTANILEISKVFCKLAPAIILTNAELTSIEKMLFKQLTYCTTIAKDVNRSFANKDYQLLDCYLNLKKSESESRKYSLPSISKKIEPYQTTLESSFFKFFKKLKETLPFERELIDSFGKSLTYKKYKDRPRNVYQKRSYNRNLFKPYFSFWVYKMTFLLHLRSIKVEETQEDYTSFSSTNELMNLMENIFNALLDYSMAYDVKQDNSFTRVSLEPVFGQINILKHKIKTSLEQQNLTCDFKKKLSSVLFHLKIFEKFSRSEITAGSYDVYEKASETLLDISERIVNYVSSCSKKTQLMTNSPNLTDTFASDASSETASVKSTSTLNCNNQPENQFESTTKANLSGYDQENSIDNTQGFSNAPDDSVNIISAPLYDPVRDEEDFLFTSEDLQRVLDYCGKIRSDQVNDHYVDRLPPFNPEYMSKILYQDLINSLSLYEPPIYSIQNEVDFQNNTQSSPLVQNSFLTQPPDPYLYPPVPVQTQQQTPYVANGSANPLLNNNNSVYDSVSQFPSVPSDELPVLNNSQPVPNISYSTNGSLMYTNFPQVPTDSLLSQPTPPTDERQPQQYGPIPQ